MSSNRRPPQPLGRNPVVPLKGEPNEQGRRGKVSDLAPSPTRGSYPVVPLKNTPDKQS